MFFEYASSFDLAQSLGHTDPVSHSSMCLSFAANLMISTKATGFFKTQADRRIKSEMVVGKLLRLGKVIEVAKDFNNIVRYEAFQKS